MLTSVLYGLIESTENSPALNTGIEEEEKVVALPNPVFHATLGQVFRELVVPARVASPLELKRKLVHLIAARGLVMLLHSL